MNPLFYFLHGWAYDQEYGRSFMAAADNGVLGEMGFFGKAPTSYPEEDFIGIGHSMGFLKMLLDWPPNMKALIGINSFPKFCQAEDYPQGVPLFVLERMKEKLDSDPATLLKNFWAKNGIPGPGGEVDIVKLKAALDFLIEADGRALLKKTKPGSLLVLSGKRDNILQVKEADFAPHPHLMREGGHNLPHEEADWCWSKVAAFLNAHAR